MTALDFVGPLDVLSHWPGAAVSFVASRPDPLLTDTGLPIRPTATPDDLPDPDLLLIPGSGGRTGRSTTPG